MKKSYIAHRREWDGKDQSLEEHLQSVGELAKGFSQKIDMPEAGMLLGLLHDLGKYSKAFQDYIKSAIGDLDRDDSDYVDAVSLKGKIDHSSAGAQYIWQKYHDLGPCSSGSLVGQILALCIASHHSGLINVFDKESKSRFMERMAKPDELTHLEECKSAVDQELLAKVESLSTEEFCVGFLSKLYSFVDELTAPSKVEWFYLGHLTRFLFSSLIDADRLNSAEFENPERETDRLARADYFDWEHAILRMEGFLENLVPQKPIDHIRGKISEAALEKSQQARGLYTFTVPTGGGKTYASLRFALHHAAKHGMDRIIYIIPYTSIIEQNAQEIRKVIERDGDQFPWVLEHHSNLEPEQQTWRSKLVSENWDSPIVLTTMVQFLEANFAGATRSVRRLHQLANSVLIFDEIQTLPINCVHLFCNALNFFVGHCGTTAMLCTATQPVLDDLEDKACGALDIAPENEIIPDVNALFKDLNRVDIINCLRPKGWSDHEIANLARQQLQETNSCLVIVNTKDWAQRLFKLCNEFAQSGSLYHLSTNQCPAHRKDILDVVRKRLKDNLPTLCISTQLIEAGVDVSFARVIRFLAGLDSIAQAAGRCNRHGELKGGGDEPLKGKVLVVNPDHETTQLLLDIEKGKESTRRVLEHGFDNFTEPAAIKQYFEYFFHERKKDMHYPLLRKKLGRDDSLLNLLSDNPGSSRTYTDRFNEHSLLPLLSQSFMEAGKQFNAIDAPTQSVIVPYKNGAEIITKLCAVDSEFDAKTYYALLRQAQKYSVNVFPDVWKRLCAKKLVHEIQGLGVYYLSEDGYSSDFGVTEDGRMGAAVC